MLGQVLTNQHVEEIVVAAQPGLGEADQLPVPRRTGPLPRADQQPDVRGEQRGGDEHSR